MNEVVTNTAKVWLGKDDIIHLESLGTREQTLDDAIENVAAVARIAAGTRRPLLIHFKKAAPQTPECRAYYTSEPATASITACAILTDSMLGRVIGNLMIGMNKTPTPIRLFATEKEAREWLEEFPVKSSRQKTLV